MPRWPLAGSAEEKSPAAAYLPALRRYFQRRVPAASVDDLVQEVCVSLCARRTGRTIDNDEAYLFTVARNVLAHHWRRRSAGAATVNLEEAGDIVDLTPSCDRWLIGREHLDLAIKAIADMPPRTRDAFVMHRFEEMSYAAIARELGVSVSAVEKHIMAALQILLRALGREK